ncbi:MAG TPA: hypothetical protein VF369_08255 [candidate division Zixibacteria bacterium]
MVNGSNTKQGRAVKGRYRTIKCSGGVVFLLPFLLFLISFAFGAWFGQESCSSHWGVNTFYADTQRFQAPEDGISTRMEILTFGETGSGTLRLAVYNDSIGHPGHKLWEGTNISYMAGTWCGENVTAIQLIQNNYYWFAFKVSTTEEVCYTSGPTDSHEWKSGQPYANPFPDPWGGYTGHNSNRYTLRMYYTTSKGTKGIIEIDPGIIEGGIIR